MENEVSELSLKEERLRLEREALELERGRLEAARAHAAVEAQLARRNGRFHSVAVVALLSALCFASGVMAGFAICESRQRQQREERLAQALSRIGAIASGSSAAEGGLDVSTNGVGAASSPSTAHGNVSVMVIQ